MSEVKQRRKANLSTKPNEDEQKEQLGSESTASRKSFRMDPRTILSSLSLLACIGLTWFLFQQSAQLVAVEEKYHLLKHEAVKFQDIENKINLMSQKCEKTLSLIEQLQDLHIIARMKHLQQEMHNIQTRSNKIIQEEEELQQNLTSLFQAVIKYEESTTSVTKDLSVKIATVKTDLRRISGLEADVTLLVESIQTLEDKVEKAEKTTVQSIGDLLTNSIDRTANLRSTASDNTRQIERIKTKLSELNADISEYSNKLFDLESDRAKVLKTVVFANDLKPKVHNLKKDFAHLEPMIDELTVRVGRLFGDLLERQKEIAFLNKQLSNLTSLQTEVKSLNDEITKVLNLN
ncbi:inhibitor of nuclear factor kappa-B kinase-interacting protein isoform X2 [Hemicordylus capensis]|uniref:inhibitor of nuclear factor kappa-B kinase-interacting protein isoform X2 n=1 Tax=Hemicordylus capensis TaxID=884348 RepID=UPI002302C397|nr:inhibitor of nuclear factor kappa-B kinase-interacting protein isoform X2 [Hemicordylus capensis]